MASWQHVSAKFNISRRRFEIVICWVTYFGSFNDLVLKQIRRRRCELRHFNLVKYTDAAACYLLLLINCNISKCFCIAIQLLQQVGYARGFMPKYSSGLDPDLLVLTGVNIATS
ncbi:hypothetical protein GGR50DRAFT_377765 [Xylaria sp. CBS 124048]|nr:hypothetical protein GGR50DRAFT_377765 [Xylaria sp. CBS 124048]